MFSAWMRILAAVPGSVLWLLADNDTARANMLRLGRRHGVAASGWCSRRAWRRPSTWRASTLADLMLDTFPFNAGTTASDALWMGLPIVTRAGRTYISRMAGSLLTAVGLPDLITDNLADYERLAITLGRQPARVASHRATWPNTAALAAVRPAADRARHRDAFERLALRRPPRTAPAADEARAEHDEHRSRRRRLGPRARRAGACARLADAPPRARRARPSRCCRACRCRAGWRPTRRCARCARPASAPAWCSARWATSTTCCCRRCCCSSRATRHRRGAATPTAPPTTS
jgi:hypothetical protein